MTTYDRGIEARGTLAEPRIIDPEWLASCPPDIQAVYAYWKLKAGNRRMPSRADIDPADLIPYLPSIMLVDVWPGDARDGSRHDYVYRLVGTREVAMRGSDPTGQRVATHSFGHDPELAFKNYDAVVRHAEPLLDRSEEFSPDRRMADLDAIFLPLSTDGMNVNMILVYTVQESFWP